MDMPDITMQVTSRKYSEAYTSESLENLDEKTIKRVRCRYI